MRLIGNGLNRVGIEEKFIVEITVLYRNIEFTKAGHSNAALIGFGEIPFWIRACESVYEKLQSLLEGYECWDIVDGSDVR